MSFLPGLDKSSLASAVAGLVAIVSGTVGIAFTSDEKAAVAAGVLALAAAVWRGISVKSP